MKEKMTFEAALGRLDEIALHLENPETTLDDSLRLFAEGAKLLSYCNTELKNAKQKVEKLLPSEDDENAEN